MHKKHQKRVKKPKKSTCIVSRYVFSRLHCHSILAHERRSTSNYQPINERKMSSLRGWWRHGVTWRECWRQTRRPRQLLNQKRAPPSGDVGLCRAWWCVWRPPTTIRHLHALAGNAQTSPLLNGVQIQKGIFRWNRSSASDFAYSFPFLRRAVCRLSVCRKKSKVALSNLA